MKIHVLIVFIALLDLEIRFPDLKIWCDVRRRKSDKGSPSKADAVKAYAEKLKDRDVLSLKDFLMDHGYAEELVDSVLDTNLRAPRGEHTQSAAPPFTAKER